MSLAPRGSCLTARPHAPARRPDAGRPAQQQRQQWRQQLRAPPLAAPCRAGDDRHGSGGVDWDREWSSFSSGGGGPARGGVRAYAQRRRGGGVPVDPSAKLTRDAIKREESVLLNAWSSGAFQGAGAALAVLVLLGVLLAAGPPPADSRCTLPWC
ncbi:hypothetical protein HT031_005316 [Scenedesmus sp. PABB004]|nr:hypothetical protein HT031_005316 [Scenedesmus sp. PABB004]